MHQQASNQFPCPIFTFCCCFARIPPTTDPFSTGTTSPMTLSPIHCSSSISSETTVACSTVTLFAAGTPATVSQQQQQEEGEEEKKEEEEEEIYAPLGGNDEYDTILNSSKAPAIASRPPVPTPRPQSSAEVDRTPYIAKGTVICSSISRHLSSREFQSDGADPAVIKQGARTRRTRRRTLVCFSSP